MKEALSSYGSFGYNSSRGSSSCRGNISSHGSSFSRNSRNGGVFQLVEITCFYADIKKMPVDGFFDDFFISVAESGKPDPVPLIGFGNNIKKLNFASPALNAVTLHAASVILIIGKNLLVFMV